MEIEGYIGTGCEPVGSAGGSVRTAEDSVVNEGGFAEATMGLGATGEPGGVPDTAENGGMWPPSSVGCRPGLRCSRSRAQGEGRQGQWQALLCAPQKTGKQGKQVDADMEGPGLGEPRSAGWAWL